MKTPEDPEASDGPVPSAEHPRAGRSAGDSSSGQPVATASYVADITQELSGLARAAGLDTLAYLLDIAKLEATQFVHRAGQSAPLG